MIFTGITLISLPAQEGTGHYGDVLLSKQFLAEG